jgi:hypothetical protein
MSAFGHSGVCTMVVDVATFARTGPPVQVMLNHPSGFGVANMCGVRPQSGSDSGSFMVAGDGYLLNAAGGWRLAAMVTAGRGRVPASDLRALAVPFGLAWSTSPMLRLAAWTLFLYWAADETWQSVFQFSIDAGVDHGTAARYFERAIAVGLPRATGVESRMVKPPRAGVRQQCVLTLLEARRFAAGWSEMIEVVDEHSDTIEDGRNVPGR